MLSLKPTWSKTKGATMSSAPLSYVPRPDTTPERELDALAAVLRFVLDCHAKKNPAAGPSERGSNDGKAKEVSADESIIRD
jgi:hypothetical protein